MRMIKESSISQEDNLEKVAKQNDDLTQKLEEVKNELCRSEKKRYHYKDEVNDLELKKNGLERKTEDLASLLKTREETLVKVNSKAKAAEKQALILNKDL